MSYAGFMEQTVFKPCGMTDTTSMKEGNVQASIRKNAWYNPVNSSKGCGDVHSSAVDLLRYHRALFGGHLLSEGSMKEIMNFVDGYGFGWQHVIHKIAEGEKKASEIAEHIEGERARLPEQHKECRQSSDRA